MEEEVTESPKEEAPADDPLSTPRPWTYASLVDRFGEEEGEKVYCAIAVAGGYFNPKAEPHHRPDLG